MPRRVLAILVALASVAILTLALRSLPTPGVAPERTARPGTERMGDGTTAEPEGKPTAWFYRQRAFPHPRIDPAGQRLAITEARELARVAEDRRRRGDKSALLSTVWQQRGPDNIGARVTDLAIHPTQPDVCYAAIATGGVLKTTDGGQTWTPIFDQADVITIGAIALDPQDPETIWVGTGEANANSYSFFGNGVYRSQDGGVTWEHLGLEETLYISRVRVDPTDGERVFVAATGRLFGTGPNRGVYRTLDGGASWDRVFALTDSTACSDLVMHPDDPDILYAGMWERVRGLTYRDSGGESSGIWRSRDGGETWSELTVGLPSGPDVGRVGLTICRDVPDVLYAIYAAADASFLGVYKSTDGGDTWSGTNDWALSGIYSTFGWYFGQIRVDPTDPGSVFALGVPQYRSTDGGQSWQENGANMHVDHHALEFAPSQPSRVYNGNDGGIYRSDDGGTTWTKLFDQPTNQFYAVEIDQQQPERLYGGTQDNGTLRTLGGVSDWERIFGGDGFTVIVDPTDSDVIYVEYQYGNLFKSTNGGGWFSSAMDGIASGDRRNWHTPVVMDPTDPQRLYYGSQRVYRSTDGAGSWSPISGDLTDGDQGANFGTVTTIAVAPSSPSVLYAGTDDGHVWVYSPFDGQWRDISAGLPVRWVTEIKVDPADHRTAYVTFSGLRWDDPISHVYRTTDAGATWQDIGQGLPEAPVNALEVDPDHPQALYVGTDVGVYYTGDLGGNWLPLGTGLPRAPVLDLDFHQPTRTLVAGTHGRSLFTVTAPAPTTPVQDLPAAVAVDLRAAPNPFNPATTLRFELAAAGAVRLEIYDVRGNRVATVAERSLSAGRHEIRWDATDPDGRPLGSGLYLARLVTDAGTATTKLMLAR
jgi:photosystem II stability/assembly factor-like uncharacterized protein